jgi:hypothetical protein
MRVTNVAGMINTINYLSICDFNADSKEFSQLEAVP